MRGAARRVFRRSSCPPTPRATRRANPKTRWACARPTQLQLSLTICAFRMIRCSATKGWGSCTRWKDSTPAGSASARRRWGSRGARSSIRSAIAPSANSSARRSRVSRPCSSSSATWRLASKRRARSRIARRPAKMPAKTSRRMRRWSSCSRPRRRCGSRRRRFSSSGAMVTCEISPSRNSSGTQRSPRSMKAPAKSSASSSRAPSATAKKEEATALFALLEEHEHEQVSLVYEPSSGYRGIIAIHDTTLGPALGGTRFWNYLNDREALIDCLRLARGMTYKAAVAGLNLGGGKSVIIGDNKIRNREPIFRAHGRHVKALGGRYITAEDVGTSVGDMEFIKAETDHVTGLIGKSGDPSPVTAFGVYRGIKACAKHRYGDAELRGKKVAIQGCGHVGYYLAELLYKEGADLIVTDIDSAKVERVVKAFEAKAVATDDIYGVPASVFAPCALGGIINDQTIAQLEVDIVAGGANNQLAEERHGDMLEERGITYAPDYVINAGGLVNVNAELEGWTMERARNKAGEIFDTILMVFDIAAEERMPSYRAADRLAERRIAAIGKVRQNFV